MAKFAPSWITISKNQSEPELPMSIHLERFLAALAGSSLLLHDVVIAFGRAPLPYALVGLPARKCWLKHQGSTKNADFLGTDEYTQNMREALNLLHDIHKFSPFPHMITLERHDCPLKIDIMIATAWFDPEESCVHDAVSLFLESTGRNVRVAKPGYLAWMLATSPHERHRRDLLRLLSSKTFNLNRLRRFMLHADDRDSLCIIDNGSRLEEST